MARNRCGRVGTALQGRNIVWRGKRGAGIIWDTITFKVPGSLYILDKLSWHKPATVAVFYLSSDMLDHDNDLNPIEKLRAHEKGLHKREVRKKKLKNHTKDIWGPIPAVVIETYSAHLNYA